MGKMGVILSRYPVATETFIMREFKKLEEKGIDLHLLSLKNPPKGEIADYRPSETVYLPYFPNWSMINSNVRFFLRYCLRIAFFFFFVISKNISKPLNIIKFLAVMPKTIHYYSILKSEGVKHIHAHWSTLPALCAYFLNRTAGMTFSFTAHAWDIYVDQSMLKDKIKAASFVTTCTDYNREYLQNFCRKKRRKKINLNYHGIETERYLPKSDYHQDSLILTAGRLVEKKGLGYLLRAVQIMKKKRPALRCIVVGSGPKERDLKVLAGNLGIEGNVTFTGRIDHGELAELMREAAVFVLPCIRAEDGSIDGIPNVLAESLAVGTPVVSTNISGIPELITDGREGRLVGEKNEVALAEAVEELLDSGKLRRAMGERGREKVERMFDSDRNADKLIDIFKRYSVEL